MKAKEIIESIERMAPTRLQEPYDNTGIQIGDTENDIRGILISVDITENVVDEAIAKGANMIVAHHPLLFRGLKKITGGSYVERVAVKAIKNDIVLYAAHTNLDKCKGGVSWKMARMLGLTDVTVLVPDEGKDGTGLGCVGNLPEAMGEREALMMVKRVFGAECVRHTALKGKPNTDTVTKIAVCGGSGAEFIENAIEAGAQLFVTGDIKYHEFFNADNKIVIADIGHFESERATKEIFYAEISKLFPKFAVEMSESEHNVVNYI